MARIKLSIKPGGKVSYVVEGVQGPDCIKLTENLSQKLGIAAPVEMTAESHLEAEQTLTQSVGG